MAQDKNTAGSDTVTVSAYEDAEIPQRLFVRVPNPHAGKVAELAASGKAAAFTLKGSNSTDRKVNKPLNLQRRLLSRAGRDLDPQVTVRTAVESVDGGVRITFWTTPKIVKGTASATEEPAK